MVVLWPLQGRGRGFKYPGQHSAMDALMSAPSQLVLVRGHPMWQQWALSCDLIYIYFLMKLEGVLRSI